MIHTYKQNAGIAELTKGDLELFTLTKIRNDNKCSMCQKSIKKGCYCLGKGFYKYCLECSPKVIDNFISSVEGYIGMLKKLKIILENNKEEYMRNNLANSL